MTKVKHLRNRDGEQFYPVTSTQAVYDADGNTLEERLALEGADSVKAEPTDKVLEGIEPNIVTDALRKTEQALSEAERKQVLKNLGNPEFKLFVDMWNEAAKGFGSYNKSTGMFELNGIKNIGYEEALGIYRESSGANYLSDYCHPMSSARTFFPIKNSKGDWWNNAVKAFGKCANLEIIRFENSTYIGISQDTFHGCNNLRKILGGMLRGVSNTALSLPKLEEFYASGVSASVNLSAAPNVLYVSIEHLVANAANTSAITITLHPDAYARVTDELFALAAEKNITIASV